MQTISPGGFALAIVILVVIWMFLPDAAKGPLAILLILLALGSTGKPAETVKGFFERYLK